MIASIGRAYPGRACAGPVLDVFVTLLSLGSSGYKTLLAQRKGVFIYLKQQMETVAAKHGERLLVTGKNAISIGALLTALKLAGFRGVDGGEGRGQPDSRPSSPMSPL